MLKVSVLAALLSATMACVRAGDVFAHYMALGPPPDGSYDNDMKLAKSLNIDAFAFNYGSGNGGDIDHWDQIMQDLYDAAERNGMKGFISLDLTTPNLHPDHMIDLVKRFKDHPAQYHDPSNGNLFLSTFQTSENTGFSWPNDVLGPIGVPISFYPGSINHDPSIFNQADATGVFTWVHNELNTQEESDVTQSFSDASKSKNKPWMAAVASWFFKHYEKQNWGNNQDQNIFVTRFHQLLKLQPKFIEILTWNDFGESHYIGQNDPQKKTGQDWATLQHSGFRGIAANFIDAFHQGKTEVEVDSSNEQLYVFYRTQPWDSYGTNDPVQGGAKPPGFTEADNIYVVTFMASDGGYVHVTNGGKTQNIAVPAGVHITSVPFSLGSVSVTLTRGNNEISKKSGEDIVQSHPIYNGNVVCV